MKKGMNTPAKSEKPTGEYSRYLRVKAERFAEARGYAARLLRKARQRGSVTIFPIDGAAVAVEVDGDGSVSMVPFWG